MNAIVGQTLKGQTKSITVDEDGVTIAYRALYHGFKGDKRLPFSSITAIQFREPGTWLSGYIQFSIKGGVEWIGQINQDENALQFDRAAADAFRALRDFVQSRIEHPGVATASVSVADELAKLANLRILTPEEFAQQKARLLG
ncbi:DUF4429 domain-containing protein [Hephaestia sp. GCM10023244]|uniref:DUF4429 domain-containing protein n=1 Tax=unclassified Hephaestia TaxID=2631281 RepID=UPI002077309A|nr:DUF4429 domain-containing protein [Hephaestia sp. MAHUQ-44]MCM8730456.1 DUF4429 domain-containing protein [Hephaestia sp. MAHUQ-44]